MIAAKNHRNGVGNPYAQLRKDLGYDFCRHASEKNPFVAGPLKRTDCSLVSDGAAALVLADVGTALRLGKAVAFRAAAHVQDYMQLPLTCNSGDNFIINSTAAVQVGGTVWYSVLP